MHLLKRNAPRAALLALVLVATGCAGHRPPVTVVTPQGQAAWYASRAVLVFEAIVDTATGLNKLQRCTAPTAAVEATSCRPTLSDTNTRVTLQIAKQTVVALGKTPDGWRATTISGLASIRTALDAAGKTQLAEWLALGETLLKEKP